MTDDEIKRPKRTKTGEVTICMPIEVLNDLNKQIMQLKDHSVQLREIVEALANYGQEDHFCRLCNGDMDLLDAHWSACPYRMAREWVDDGT